MSCFKTLSVCFIIGLCQGGHFVQGASVTAGTSAEFQQALNDAISGDIISLLALDYVGDFVLTAPEPTATITINGAAARILGTQTALQITSGSWTIQSLTIGSGEVAIDIKGSGSVIRSVTISNTTQGVNVEGNDNILESVVISASTSGILINGSRNLVLSCTIGGASAFGIKVASGEQNILESDTLTKLATNAKGFLLEADSCCGKVISTTTSDLSEIRGDSYEIRSTTIDGGLNIFGCQNVFVSDTIDKVYLTDVCNTNDLTTSNTVGEYVTTPIV